MTSLLPPAETILAVFFIYSSICKSPSFFTKDETHTQRVRTQWSSIGYFSAREHSYLFSQRFQFNLVPYVTIQVLPQDKMVDLAALNSTTVSKPHTRRHMGSSVFIRVRHRVTHTHKARDLHVYWTHWLSGVTLQKSKHFQISLFSSTT